MGESDHAAKAKKSEFCDVRSNPPTTCKCPSPNDHRKVCEPPSSWNNLFFVRLEEQPKRDDIVLKEYRYEAHHILCVKCIQPKISGNSDVDPSIDDVVRQTRWCINDERNMIALPQWGHTIQWYCDLSSGDFIEETVDGLRIAPHGAPPFADLPMHDYDHIGNRGYDREVKQELQKIAEQASEASTKEKHKEVIKQLKTELNKLSDHFRSELESRGGRQSGTHKSWESAMNDGSKGSKWYEPFSMGKSPTPRSFPTFVGPKIESLVESYGWI